MKTKWDMLKAEVTETIDQVLQLQAKQVDALLDLQRKLCHMEIYIEREDVIKELLEPKR